MCGKMPWAVLGFSSFIGFGEFYGLFQGIFLSSVRATGGAAVGSLGGPGTAAGGAAVGWGVGEVSKYMEENVHLTQQVKALSEGDIKQLVNNQLDESMDNGFLTVCLLKFMAC